MCNGTIHYGRTRSGYKGATLTSPVMFGMFLILASSQGVAQQISPSQSIVTPDSIMLTINGDGSLRGFVEGGSDRANGKTIQTGSLGVGVYTSKMKANILVSLSNIDTVRSGHKSAFLNPGTSRTSLITNFAFLLNNQELTRFMSLSGGYLALAYVPNQWAITAEDSQGLPQETVRSLGVVSTGGGILFDIIYVKSQAVDLSITLNLGWTSRTITGNARSDPEFLTKTLGSSRMDYLGFDAGLEVRLNGFRFSLGVPVFIGKVADVTSGQWVSETGITESLVKLKFPLPAH